MVDLLVVYTPAARVAYGQATLASMIQNAVAMANQAYLNSKVAVTLNLVGLQEISYTESGLSNSLDYLRGTNDGKMDSVHQLRNSVGADVVTLVSEDSGGCGIARVMTTVSNAFAPEAFNVVKTSCLSQHSLAHEVGHNMGNKHDRESTTDTGAYPYSYGFRRCTSDGTGFRTVMSYSCTGAKARCVVLQSQRLLQRVRHGHCVRDEPVQVRRQRAVDEQHRSDRGGIPGNQQQHGGAVCNGAFGSERAVCGGRFSQCDQSALDRQFR